MMMQDRVMHTSLIFFDLSLSLSLTYRAYTGARETKAMHRRQINHSSQCAVPNNAAHLTRIRDVFFLEDRQDVNERIRSGN